MRTAFTTTAVLLSSLTLTLYPGSLDAQQEHVHDPGMHQDAGSETPTETGQSAFAALQEVVALLEADPATDWSQVDLERLRQHLLDMDEVTLRSRVEAEPVDGGAGFVVTGEGRIAEAIRRIAPAHAGQLTGETPYRWQVEEVPGGVRILATAQDASDAGAVERIRSLGFIGMLVQGMHHGPHHLALARGADPHHGH